MKITITVSDKKISALQKELAGYEIPAAFVVTKLKSYIQSTEHESGYFVTDYVYPNRDAAIRAAVTYLDNYTGTPAIFLSFKVGRRVVVERFALNILGRRWLPSAKPTLIQSKKWMNEGDFVKRAA
jgi:hypothetical protein